MSKCLVSYKLKVHTVTGGTYIAGGMWFNNNESNNWESDHSTYFGLRFILFEHLELLEHRATLTASKTILFCVVYSRKKIVLSGCQCLFSLILVGNHRKRVTHY